MEFDHAGWSWYIAITSIVSVLACAALLTVVGRKRSVGQGDTTGHVWDQDLVELNNPMPRWWVGLFYITIVFGLLYMVLYPTLGVYGGVLGWTQEKQHAQQVSELEQQSAPVYASFANKDTAALARDPAAVAIGQRLFLNNCAQCHGSDARGAKGYPNLADDDWLHGGTPEAIRTTITQGRHGVMPVLTQAIGNEADVENLIHYVMSLSNSGGDPVKVALGRDKFTVCAACHGPGGQGNLALGAPNLTDKVWLYGGGYVAIEQTVRKGREGVMPPHNERLNAAQIELLTAYVWGLSNAAGAAASR
jgi:cytochrome c oxidase cbb3-type subunit III